MKKEKRIPVSEKNVILNQIEGFVAVMETMHAPPALGLKKP